MHDKPAPDPGSDRMRAIRETGCAAAICATSDARISFRGLSEITVRRMSNDRGYAVEKYRTALYATESQHEAVTLAVGYLKSEAMDERARLLAKLAEVDAVLCRLGAGQSAGSDRRAACPEPEREGVTP